MYCTHCGHELDKNEKYCTNCGVLCDSNYEKNAVVSNSSDSSTTLSMIFGILSCVLFWMPIISIPLAIVALIMGFHSRKESNKISVGVILGIISIVLTVLMIILFIFIFRVIVDNIDLDDDYQKDIIEHYREKINDIRGYSWLGEDNSMLYLYNDFSNLYEWYERDSDHEDNYHKGVYEIYQGKDALEYINNNLQRFGFTEERQKEFFKNDNDVNDYYLMILTCNQLKIRGDESNGEDKTLYYYGVYKGDANVFEGVNMSTGKKISFVRKEYLKSRIDV